MSQNPFTLPVNPSVSINPSNIPGLATEPLDAWLSIRNVFAKTYIGSFANAGVTGNMSVTNVGFSPKAVLFLSRISTTTAYTQCIGFANIAKSACQSTTNSGNVISDTTNCVNLYDGTHIILASLLRFDGNGFTLSYSSAQTATTTTFICFG